MTDLVAKESKLQNTLRRLSLTGYLGLALALAAFIFTLFTVTRIFTESYAAHARSYIDRYKEAIEQQVSSDFNTLRTISLFFDPDNPLNRTVVREAQSYNGFTYINYWGTDGSYGYIAARDSEDFRVLSLPDDAHREVINLALSGQSAVSVPFHSSTLKRDVIVYAVPVYNGKHEIKAVISAVKEITHFSEILENLPTNLHSVALYLSDSQGHIFADDDPEWHEHEIHSLTGLDFLGGAQRLILKNALQGNESATIDFICIRHGDECTMQVIPVNVNHWKIIAVDHPDLTAAPVSHAVRELTFTLFGIFVITLAMGLVVFAMMRRNYRRQLRLTLTDPLTGGYNLPKFTLELQRHGYIREKSSTLVVFNVRDFRYIADFAGKELSDSLLTYIYGECKRHPRIISVCHDRDALFYALIHESDEAALRALLTELFTSISKAFKLSFSLFPAVFYAGAVHPGQESTPQSLFHQVRFALRLNPRGYNHSVTFYDETAYRKELLNRDIEGRMREALASHEFKVYLQPKYSLALKRTVAAEALVRWVRPDGSVVMPSDFIPLFEQNGFCAELDLYILEEVCRQIHEWLEKGYPPLHVSVNQSKLLLFRSDYLSIVQHLLGKYKLPARVIVIEVLETILAQDLPTLNPYLKKLRQAGLSISMDDFGSGYSSLNMLSSLEIDEIKFDKDFLMEKDEERKHKNRVILSQLLSLIRALNIRTVVEGVENREDLLFLNDEGVDLAQGYYFSRPVSLSEFEVLYLRPAVEGHPAPTEPLPQDLEAAAAPDRDRSYDATDTVNRWDAADLPSFKARTPGDEQGRSV